MSDILSSLGEGVSLQDVLSATYNDMDADFQARIPSELLDDLSSFGNALADYEPGQNEFVYSLINHIGLVTVNYKMFKNPLSVFKRGKLEFGDTIEDAYVDVIKGMLYEPEVPNGNGGDQWETFKPETDVVFHKINKAMVYPLSINPTMIRRAFKSYKEMDKFLSGCINQMYNADELDEFELTCKLLGSYADINGVNGYYRVHTDAVTNEATAKAFVTKARAIFNMLKFPSRKFNAKGVMSWSRPEDLYMLVTPALTAYMDVNVLASAFNMGKAEFLGKIIEVPEIPVLNGYAILCDKEFFQIWDTEIRMASTGLNARHLTQNMFYHHQGIFSLSPFYNAILFTTDAVVEPVSLSIVGDTSILAGQTKNYTADVVGGSTQAVYWTVVGEPQYVSINQNGNLTVGAKYTGATVTIKAVSVEKESVYATKEITVGSSARPSITVDQTFTGGKAYGVDIDDLQDIEIAGNAIVGELKYYDGSNETWASAWGADKKAGNFLNLHFTFPTGTTATFEIIGGEMNPVTLDNTGEVSARITSVAQSIRVIATKGGISNTKVWSLAGLTLEEE